MVAAQIDEVLNRISFIVRHGRIVSGRRWLLPPDVSRLTRVDVRPAVCYPSERSGASGKRTYPATSESKNKSGRIAGAHRRCLRGLAADHVSMAASMCRCVFNPIASAGMIDDFNTEFAPLAGRRVI